MSWSLFSPQVLKQQIKESKNNKCKIIEMQGIKINFYISTFTFQLLYFEWKHI